MILNCLSRLEVISYLYGHRHDIAFSLGITAEKVIAMCNGNHFQDSQLNQPQEDKQQLPSGLAPSQELIPACLPSIVATPGLTFKMILNNNLHYCLKEYYPPYSEIFHPPLA
jgi:hypothetical protein